MRRDPDGNWRTLSKSIFSDERFRGKLAGGEPAAVRAQASE
jgi:hypothetical protein